MGVFCARTRKHCGRIFLLYIASNCAMVGYAYAVKDGARNGEVKVLKLEVEVEVE